MRGREPRWSIWYGHESVYRAYVALIREICKVHGHAPLECNDAYGSPPFALSHGVRTSLAACRRVPCDVTCGRPLKCSSITEPHARLDPARRTLESTRKAGGRNNNGRLRPLLD
ncbi:hypothetical protein EVAR_5650_1 [Eumeta japonica]|uniref:Uncharacterized protein n=1 Tax=Eumeta variegata TaxID=151549 RepID=A0A4C1T870_EUMVA|nr:hypothetical protein EVAR_5650_1 [Eumeta japonica]